MISPCFADFSAFPFHPTQRGLRINTPFGTDGPPEIGPVRPLSRRPLRGADMGMWFTRPLPNDSSRIRGIRDGAWAVVGVGQPPAALAYAHFVGAQSMAQGYVPADTGDRRKRGPLFRD